MNWGPALMPPVQSLAAVLVFRACTVYVHIVIGLLYISYKSGVMVVLRKTADKP